MYHDKHGNNFFVKNSKLKKAADRICPHKGIDIIYMEMGVGEGMDTGPMLG